MHGTCCAFQGAAAADDLVALGKPDVAELMQREMSHEGALIFAAKLRVTVKKLEFEHRNDFERPHGAGRSGTYDATTKTWSGRRYSTFEEAITAIWDASLWYEMVATLGFGVQAMH